MTPDSTTPGSFLVGRWLFLRIFGVTLFFAFLSLAHQVVALVGPGGLVPSSESFAQLRAAYGDWAILRAPSIFWISSHDVVLQVAMWGGVGCAVLLVLNIWPRLMALILWVLFLSVATLQPAVHGKVLFDYAPDRVTLEAGLFAIFLAPRGMRPGLGRASPVSRWARLLLYVLLFKLMFGSGMAKLVNGQEVWWDLSALYFDYETRPSPTPLAVIARELPSWTMSISVLFTLFAEVVMPWLYFCGRRLRQSAALTTLVLMVGIMATGNYRWFPLSAFAIGLLLLDDRFFDRFLGRLGRRLRLGQVAVPSGWLPRARGIAAGAVASAVILLGVCQTLDSCVPAGNSLKVLQTQRDWLAPYHVSHGFAVFGRVRERLQGIVFEGSDDGLTWKPFDNRLGPGVLDRPRRFAAPYHYYLDFLMWMSSDLGWYSNPGWVKNLTQGLLRGYGPTYGLFGHTPWLPERPPRYVRGALYLYRIAPPELRGRGQAWTREPAGLWCPAVTLHEGSLIPATGLLPAVNLKAGVATSEQGVSGR